MASYYIATDDPQKTNPTGVGLQRHEEALQAYGPPPPTYIVERYLHQQISKASGKRVKTNMWRMRYKELSSSSNAPWSYDHPLSSAVQSPVIHNETLLVRKKAHGVFDVPFTYKTGELIWHHNSSAFGALAVAMNGVGMKNKAGNAITEADLRDLYDTIPQQNKDARQNSVLYHPTDRDSIVWPDEPALSIIASTLNRSLIILSPFVAANGAGSNRMYDRTNRAPIYARWSTGRQGLKPPLILGCLPKQVSNAEPRIKAMWFSVQPDQTRDPSWARSIYAGENIKTLADRIGFPITSFNGKDHVFLWALVSLQRRIVLGAIPDDTNLGCWLWQFGKHLVDNCIGWTDPVPAPFKFDAAKDPKYNKQFQSGYLSFQTLSCLVLSPRMTVNNSSTEQYAALWDQAIDAQIVYKRNQTDQNWDDFAKKMEKARHIPL